MHPFKNPIILLTTLVLSGCASNIPREIREAPVENPTVREVRDNIDRYTSCALGRYDCRRGKSR